MDDYGKNIKQMLEDRGYKNPSLDNFPGLIFSVKDDLNLPKSTFADPDVAFKRLHSSINHIIAIVDDVDKWWKSAEYWVAETEGNIAEIFNIDYFLTDHPEFYLNPKMEKVEDIQALNSAYKVEIPLLEWPMISIHDPLARWYDMRFGQQVKLIREDRIDYAIVADLGSIQKEYFVSVLVY